MAYVKVVNNNSVWVPTIEVLIYTTPYQQIKGAKSS